MKREFIVFVDDEPQVLRALVRDVTPWAQEADIEIETAESGLECIDLINQLDGVVSIIVSDLRMPFIQGGELLVELRKRYPDVGLVLLTAYSDADEMQKAVSAEVSSYVLKPWDVAPLVAQLKQTLELVRTKRQNSRYAEQIDQQLKMAGEFQRSFLPVNPPDRTGILFDVTYQPVSELYCGGDYCDIIELSDSRLLLLVGDVAGHGVRSALITAMIKILTQNLINETPAGSVSASSFLNDLNSRLSERLPNQSAILVTFTAAIIDRDVKAITVANAGHLPVYRIRDNVCLALQVEGPAMGFETDIVYDEKHFDLENGDIVTVFTDGLVEAGPTGSKIKPEEIADILIKSWGADEYNASVLEHFRLAHETDAYFDDVTILTAEIG